MNFSLASSHFVCYIVHTINEDEMTYRTRAIVMIVSMIAIFVAMQYIANTIGGMR